MRTLDRLTRRDLIKMFGFAGVLATPLLRQTRSFAASDMKPIYIQLFKPNGNPHDSYYPSGEGQNFSFQNQVTESFEKVKEYIISPRELEIYKDGGNAHSEGIVRNFTNSTSIDEIHNAKGYKPCIESSIDQIIADHLYQNDPSRLKHFHFHYRKNIGYYGHALATTSFKKSPGADRAQPQYGTSDLQEMFNLLLGRFSGCGSQSAAPQNPRLSVLDHNLEEVRAIKRRLGFSANEKAKLEEFENQILLIQNDIQLLNDRQTGCPNLLKNHDNVDDDEGHQRAKIIMDLIVLATEWELTHVASFQFGSAQDGGQYRDYLDLEVRDENYHGLSHEGGRNGVNSFRKVCKFHWDNFGYLLEQLKNKETADGQNLLDKNIVLISGGDISMTEGSRHRHDKMPFFLAGRANGALETGYTFNASSNNSMNSHGRLLLSACHAAGLTHLQHVGDREKCPGGPLLEIK